MHTKHITCLALCVAAALAACGGGGGGGDSSGTTGLVPTDLPTAGATLYADATVLRPLVAGARWTYQGTMQLNLEPLATSEAYVDVITHTKDSTGVRETADNLDNAGSTEQRVYHEAGSVRNVADVDLGNGISLPVDTLELRSPVRVNDQYTVFDQRLKTGTDFDEDGVNDAVELGVYSRVVGQVLKDVGALHQASVVTVSTTYRMRAKFSKSGNYSDVVTLAQTTEYVSGLGVVLRRFDAPGAEEGLRDLTTETLVGWDGIQYAAGTISAPMVATLSTKSPARKDAAVGIAPREANDLKSMLASLARRSIRTSAATTR
jgi:hypothetical protein